MAAERAVKHPPPAGVVFRAPNAAGVWGVKRCVEQACARRLVNRDVNAAANMGWKALRQMRQLPCHPFVRPQRVRRPVLDGGDDGEAAGATPAGRAGGGDGGRPAGAAVVAAATGDAGREGAVGPGGAGGARAAVVADTHTVASTELSGAARAGDGAPAVAGGGGATSVA